MPQTVVTFGEIMLRLTPPGYERFLQSPQLQATFGGGEANVAVSLANFGVPTRFVTVLPEKNPIADACVAQLRSFGIDVSKIARSKGRMGSVSVIGGLRKSAQLAAGGAAWCAVLARISA